MRTVIRQRCCSRIGESVGSITPRQRVRINGIVRSGFIIVEVQTLKHLEFLFNLVIGDDRFVHTVNFRLQLRTKRSLIMVQYLVSADIEPIIALMIILFFICTHIS